MYRKEAMKKILLFVLPLLLVSVAPAYAEDAKTLRETRMENRQEIKSEIMENRQEVKDMRVENHQEIRSLVAENHANRLERRFKFYYDRLSNIARRLETRLATLKSDGKDTSVADTKLTEATTKLETAKSLGEQAVSAFRAIDPAKFAEQKEQALAARDLANQARVAFKEALSIFKSVLKEVK